MERSARTWFIGALLGVLAMAATWYGAHEIAVLRHLDVTILQGFLHLRRPSLDRPEQWLTSFFDPFPYVFLCAVPVAIALRRGRRDLALAVLVLLVGANFTTEILKPLVAGPRDWVALPGVFLSHATWPSGHSTASMSLALGMTISAAPRWRPIVATVMAAMVVGVAYSLLTLGWHYPSDVLGGFEVASTWALAVVGAQRALLARRLGPAPRTLRAGPRPSLIETLRPPAIALACALGLAAALTALRPEQVLGYLTDRTTFVVGAAAIAVLSFACASGFSLLLRRSPDPLAGSRQAPTAAHSHRHSLLG